MKNKKYHTVETAPKLNQNEDRDKFIILEYNYIQLNQIRMIFCIPFFIHQSRSKIHEVILTVHLDSLCLSFMVSYDTTID